MLQGGKSSDRFPSLCILWKICQRGRFWFQNYLCLFFPPPGQQQIKQKPNDTMYCEDCRIFARHCRAAVGQVHDSFQSSAGWDKIGEKGENPILHTSQIGDHRDCHKYNHNKFDVDDADHQSI